MKSDHENMYPFMDMNGKDYLTEEEIPASQNQKVASLKEKIQKRIERGNRLIYLQNKDKWEAKVRNEAEINIPCKGSIDIALEIMEMLENGATVLEADSHFRELVGANTSLKQDSLGLIFHFSKRGVEFCRGTTHYVKTDENERIYRDKEKENQSYAAAQNQKAASLEETIQRRIERGNKLIYPQRKEQWAEKVRDEATLPSPTTGSIDISLEIMELLESGASLEEIDRRYRQLIGWNTSLKWDTLSLILVFSKRGIEFYELEAPSFGVKIDEVSEFIEQLRKENDKYASDGEYASGGKKN